MALQKVFKKSYMDHLRQNINVEDYLKDKFPYEEDQCVQLAGIIAPEYDLLEAVMPFAERSIAKDSNTRMKENALNEFEVAKIIFEAFPNLTPIFAQQDDLWVYLTHAELFPYVQKRWPELSITMVDVQKNYIINHWFHNPNNFLRTTFAGLWWHTYLSIDLERSDKYELTKVFFSTGQDFRTLRFGEISLIRCREAMIGVLEFLAENPDLVESNFVARGQYISRFFNKLGAYKELAYLKRDFFKKQLTNRINIIRDLHSTEQIQNQYIEI